jgi:hypothetical protein
MGMGLKLQVMLDYYSDCGWTGSNAVSGFDLFYFP